METSNGGDQALTDDLRLPPGSKFVHNDFSEDETQPTARIAWAPGYPITEVERSKYGRVTRPY